MVLLHCLFSYNNIYIHIYLPKNDSPPTFVSHLAYANTPRPCFTEGCSPVPIFALSVDLITDQSVIIEHSYGHSSADIDALIVKFKILVCSSAENDKTNHFRSQYI